ncbi:Uncharacterized [Syntrophomonas zehnderi OL-4]|uniref:Uncharacterized n=1 Tax=Syntrophomonas zehnderi OL-4 TaxID=690567 RepID=A0A0E4G9P6_9FIRM|nr:Uncharacterized [Syntrophomonas zehnderi OL-4]
MILWYYQIYTQSNHTSGGIAFIIIQTDQQFLAQNPHPGFISLTNKTTYTYGPFIRLNTFPIDLPLSVYNQMIIYKYVKYNQFNLYL